MLHALFREHPFDILLIIFAVYDKVQICLQWRVIPISKFDFIDLFAGIGGIRLAFESIGGRCVFTSEWNEWSKKLIQQILV